jgi:hypothetical protein
VSVALNAGCQPDPKNRSQFLVQSRFDVPVKVEIHSKWETFRFHTSTYEEVKPHETAKLEGVGPGKGACMGFSTVERSTLADGGLPMLMVTVTDATSGEVVAVSVPLQMCDRIPFVIQPAP